MSTHHLTTRGRALAPDRWIGVEMPSRFEYDSADPYRIQFAATEPGNDDPVRWAFARDLLDPHADVTPHDVAVSWTATEMTLTLNGTHPVTDEWMRLVLAYPAAAMRSFVAATFVTVPRGRESMNFDAELRALLTGGR